MKPSLHARMVLTLALALSACQDGCGSDPRDPDDTTPTDDTEAPDDTEVPDDTGAPPSTATLGPEGGAVGLPDGTTLTLPPGAVTEDVTFTLTPVADAWSPSLEQGFVAIGTAFTIEPLITFVEPAVLTLPAESLPADAELTRAFVDQVAEGPVDAWDEDGRVVALGTTHPALGNDGAAEGTLSFTLTGTAPVTYLPLVEDPALSASSTFALGGLPGVLLGQPCSAAMTSAGLTPPADVDAKVATQDKLSPTARTHYALLPPADQPAFLDALSRFHARVCDAAYHSRAFYEAMGFSWLSAGPVPVSLDWDLVDRHGACQRANGTAWGGGIEMYFNPDCDPTYTGWHDPWEGSAGYNHHVAGNPTDGDTDTLEASVAHELFHYTEDRADGIDAMDFGIDDAFRSFTEGGADMMGDLCYDDVAGFAFNPAPLWQENAWSIKYPMHAFWRWLDWTQETTAPSGVPDLRDSVLVRVLTRVHDRAAASTPAGAPRPKTDERITWTDLDEVLRAMFPSRGPDWDHERALAEFASVYLFTHDFERVSTTDPACPTGPWPDDECPDHDASDHHADILGQRWAELGPGHLWGEWTEGATSSSPRVDEPTSFALTPWSVVSRAVLPMVYTIEVPEHGAQVVEIALPTSATDPGTDPWVLSVQAALTSNPLQLEEHLALQVWIRFNDPTRRAELAGHYHDISDTAGVLDTVVIPDAVADEGTIVVVLSNTGDANDTTNDAGLTVELSLEDRDPDGLVLAGFDGTIGTLDVSTPAVIDSCLDGTDGPVLPNTYRTDVQPLAWTDPGWAVAYPYGDTILRFESRTCRQLDDIDVGVGGPGPVALDLTPDGRYLVAALHDPNDPCAAGGIAVVDMFHADGPTMVASIALPVGAGDVALLDAPLGEEILVTQTGDESACFSASLVSVYLEELLVAGLGAAPSLLRTDIIAGTATHLPGRLATSPARDYAAWTMGSDHGRIGVIAASDHAWWLLESENEVRDPWENPTDVELVPVGGGFAVLFTTLYESTYWDDPWTTCGDPGFCSGFNKLTFDPATGESTVDSRRSLPWGLADDIAVTADGTRGFVTYQHKSGLTVLDLGAGAVDIFMIDETHPWIVGEPYPTRIWLP